jgi:nucleotide-binding universal stress UspA family protein
MKILIGYNGSQIAEAALDDLRRAGLPEKADAVILSVAEVWLPPENIDAAKVLARRAQSHVEKEFPRWKIKTEISYGSPAPEILSKAAELHSDIVVIGESRQHLCDGNLFLHSTSHKILSGAKCSVRIARGKIGRDPKPTRIVIGYDGSPGAQIAVDEAASRYWQPNSEARLIVVADSTVPSSIGRFVAPSSDVFSEMKIVRQQLEKLSEIPLQKLKNSGLRATLSVGTGNPKEIVIKMAEEWRADSIFVGPNHLGTSFERCLLGSVSEAIAARALCSVEVVRKNY